MNNKKKRILILIFILAIILVACIIVLSMQKNNTNNVSTEENTASYFEDSNIDKLAGFTEKERIKFYFSQYIEYIENRDLEKAYNLLYSEFKENYFPTLTEYKEYINSKYPDFISVEYINIQAEGYYYIFTVNIIDSLNDTSFEQKFIIREYNFNDVVLSFQVL